MRLIDQEPIGRTPRSNPVTYVKAFDEIRKLFAALPRAKTLGLERRRASRSTCRAAAARRARATGSRSSRCTSSRTSTSPARSARAARYRPDVLQVAYESRDIAKCSSMTVDEAVDFFAASRCWPRRLKIAAGGGARLPSPRPARHHAVGRRGPAPKIAAELARGSTGDVLYILDEPTTGPAPRRHPQAPRRAEPPGRRGQHGAGGRAPPRRDQDRRLGDGPRAPRVARRAASWSPRARPSRSRRRAAPTPASSSRCPAQDERQAVSARRSRADSPNRSALYSAS